ncbi:TRAP transporter substrate-binding protein [Pikeienuella sp. HZG-20]|uniref:TRAP transporter substrate-binding protein n=1 Tax=Paludibacillus litoralis TaxID=3133267 RepID=UPI0030EE6EAF
MKLTRRGAIGTLALGGAAATGAGLASPAIAANTRELTMVTSWPKNYPGQGTSAERIAQQVEKLSEGRIKIKVYGAGELVPAFEVFDAVASGKADMYHSAEYYFQGKSKAFAFFSTVPFGLVSNELDSWIYYGDGQALWDELSGGFGIKPLLCGNNGVQMGGWLNREINTVEDLKGLKFRMPGLGGEVLRRFGVNVINVPGGEIYTSLQSGAIDGAEFVSPWNDLAFGFHKVAKYYYWPGFHEPASALCLGTNLELWNSLSEVDRAIIETVCRSENTNVPAEYFHHNIKSLTALVEEHGVELREFPDDVFQAFGKATDEVLAEVAKEDDLTGRIHDSYVAFRNEIAGWTRISLGAYLNKRQVYLDTL